MITSEEKTTLDDINQIVITLTNGDIELVRELVDGYKFKDVGSLIAFALGAVIRGYNDDGLYTIKEVEGRDRLVPIKPQEHLIRGAE